MQTLNAADLREKSSHFRQLARAAERPASKANFNYYADRFAQQATDQEISDHQPSLGPRAV